MATIYRGAGASDTNSEAEKWLVEAFQSHSDDFTIIHSTKWIPRFWGETNLALG